MPVLVGSDFVFAEIVGGQVVFFYLSFLVLSLMTNIYVFYPYSTCTFVHMKVLDLFYSDIEEAACIYFSSDGSQI